MPTEIRELQERAARALAPAILQRHDGWWLRYADSAQWWASSVLPHGDADLPDMIRMAEKFYAGHGMRPRFQITPGTCPDGLDDLLAERGYQASGSMSLQTAPTAQVIDRLPVGEFCVDDQPSDAWFATWLAVHGGDPGPERDMLNRVENPSGYASVMTAAAVGRAVVETGWAGVFGMATRPEVRGKGAAKEVLSALARWARDQGAENMYLQVECDNAAAQRVYEHAGFIERCRYHYRVGG
jgi:N-acetylglutamate synthase